MNTNITFNNGNTIPAVGLGTFRIENNDLAAKTVASAIEVGYRHIDTAAIYGNEEGVGRGIKDSGVDRSEIFLTTKIWNDDLRSGKIKEAMAKSLEKLGTDYVDMVLVHWPAGEYTEYWKQFEELNDEGLARNIGVSNFTMRMLDELLPVCRIKPVLNQVERHPYFIQKPLLKYCDKKEIAITAWSGFMVGELLNKPDILGLAEKYEKTAAQIIQRWNYQNGVISIPKSTNQGRMKENIDIFDFNISFEDMKYMDTFDKSMRKGPNPENFNF